MDKFCVRFRTKKTFWEQILMFFSYLHCLDKKKLLVYFENHK